MTTAHLATHHENNVSSTGEAFLTSRSGKAFKKHRRDKTISQKQMENYGWKENRWNKIHGKQWMKNQMDKTSGKLWIAKKGWTNNKLKNY